jgi:hypothetical protein
MKILTKKEAKKKVKVKTDWRRKLSGDGRVHEEVREVI